jgi:hypothetical protein
MPSFSTYDQSHPPISRPEISSEASTHSRLHLAAPSAAGAGRAQDLDSQQLEGELASLQERQRALRNRLTTLQRQQLHENIGRFTRYASPSGVPDSLDMIIYGIREELERVVEQILLVQQRI